MKADLPIVYRKGSAFFAAFSYPLSAIRTLLPHPMLVPVPLVPGTGVLVAAVFDYQETSIGPYREVGLGFQCRLRRSGPLPLLPLLAERFFEDVGPWVQFLPVSTSEACEAGRTHWGFPKIVADIRIEQAEGRMTCEVLEDEKRILSVDITRPAGGVSPVAFPLRMYSALGDELLFTEVAVDAVGSTAHLGAKARLSIEDHPRVRDFDREAIERARPLEVRWLSDYRTMLDRPSVRYRMSA
jgi:hypothetical protein